jgi:threonine dehydrogenase-like Zn-dependent dehydrogenase
VPDPIFRNRPDAIVRITSTAICGSDLPPLRGPGPVPHSAGTSWATNRWASSRRSAAR